MSELITLVQEQNVRIRNLERVIDNLAKLMLKNKVDDTWVDETTAAGMLGYKDGRTLRKAVKAGSINVDFRNTNGKNWQYSRKGLLNYKTQTSTIA